MDEEDIDPLTLVNLILGKDARKEGFNWTSFVRGHKYPQEIFFKDAKANQELGAFITEAVKKKKKQMKKKSKRMLQSKRKPLKRKKQAAKPASAQPQAPGEQERSAPEQEQTPQQAPPLETNGRDPNVVSSDPAFNPCPAYMQGVCRVDGRPCVYSIVDYRECGKYSLATTGDSQLFEIPPGREGAPEYIQGIKG